MNTLIESANTMSGGLALNSLLAYLDPGAGSMLFQVLIAGLFSSMFFVRSSYSYVRDMMLAKKKKT